MNDTRLVQAGQMIAESKQLLDELIEELSGDHKEWLTAASRVLEIAHRVVRNVSLR